VGDQAGGLENPNTSQQRPDRSTQLQPSRRIAGPLFTGGAIAGSRRRTAARRGRALFINETTGVTDVVLDPRIPTWFAGSYQRSGTCRDDRPDDRAFKSTNAGT
jgi:hypothetical protein